MPSTRRDFLQLMGTGAALPAFTPRLSLAADPSARAGDILICIFKRGGVDGLNMIVPFGDNHYYDLRPNLAIAPPDQAGGALDLDGFFGMHPAMAALKPVFDAGELAVVHATGSPHDTHSHFDAMDFMERAFLEKGSVFDGWIGRHLESLDTGNASPFRAVGMGSAVQASLRGVIPAIAMNSIAGFDLIARAQQLDAVRTAFSDLYDGADPLDLQAQQAFAAVDLLQVSDPLQYAPENGAQYPDSAFGQLMLQIGQLIKADGIALEVVCVDISGWDTHNQENAVLPALLTDFADSLAAFHTDMGSRMANITLVTQSEFGRRAYENASGGSDHGHGNCMLAMGGGVNGGSVFSDWPGLGPADLYANGDLEVTTDWRTVLGELVNKRLGNDALEVIFPDYAMPGFLGIFRNLDGSGLMASSLSSAVGQRG